MFKRISVIILSISFIGFVNSQEYLIIGDIQLQGNKRTQEKTIFRESRIQKGDTIFLNEIEETLVKNRNQILSTGLFNELKYTLDSTQKKNSTLHLDITENWYLYPAVIFELADRNFNVWWQEQNRDISRTVYGVDLSHYNLTGRRDPLSFRAQAGYTRKLELKYTFPFIWKKWGISASVFYSDNKELGYKTEENKTLFSRHPNEEVMLIRRRTGFRITNRQDVFTHHSFRLEYHHNSVNEYVSEVLNNEYFLSDKSEIRFLFFEYDFQFDKRDYTLYPRDGYFIGANFKKEGLNIFKDFNNTSGALQLEVYRPLFSKLTYGLKAKAKANISRNKISYANNTGLGWGGYAVTGFDLYVMDGTDYIIFKNNINRKLFYRKFKLFKFLPVQFRTLPVELNLRFNFDFAYVNERQYIETNHINNRWFYGFGPSADLILFNNFLFSFEYGINDLGERGLYIQNSIAF